MKIQPALILLALATLLIAPAASAGNMSTIRPVLIPSGLDARDAKAAHGADHRAKNH